MGTTDRGAEGDLIRLGRLIRDRRQELGLTQAEFGRRLGWAQERISILENAKYGIPSLPALVHLADALEMPLPDFLTTAGYTGRYESVPPRPEVPAPEKRALQFTLPQLLEIEGVSLREVVTQASDLMAQAMGADKVDVFMLEPETQTLVALGTSNTPMGRLQHEAGLDRIPRANRGRTAEVFETGRAFHADHADQDPSIEVGIVETLGVRSMYLVPLRYDGEVKGVLSAASAQPERFTEEERRFFDATGRWIASIAQRAELMDALRRAAAEEARREAADELIVTLAHDLGNHLTPLKGRIDLLSRRLRREGGRDRDVAELTESLRAISGIQRMMARLLDTTRLDRGLFSLAVERVDLAQMIARITDEMRTSWPHLETRLIEGVEVEADPTRLSDVFMNLFENAIQHSPQDAPISVTMSTAERAEGPMVAVVVRDEGPGIDPEVRRRLFQRFATGRRGGLGLGLYLARGVAEAHGGTLTAESEPGQGTEFTLTLPVRIG